MPRARWMGLALLLVQAAWINCDPGVIEGAAPLPAAELPTAELPADGTAIDAGPAAPDAGPGTCGCLLGEGPYCGKRAKTAAADAGCVIPILSGHEGDLLRCEANTWSVLEPCAGSCSYGTSAKLDDSCQLPVCDCFVKVAWCGSGAAKVAATRGCRIPLLPAHHGDILYCPGGSWGVKSACAHGCVEAPTGTPDSCKTVSSYLLPFDCQTARRCSNGNKTSSHTGKDAFAYDFAMPVGTSVRAMRGGTVLRVRNVSPPGSACYNGGGSSCANYANTVEILHTDGTVGLYMHLSKILVTKGKHLVQGALVGKSGNSGWSTGPHLHCQVQKNCGIWWCQSIPFSFGEKSGITSGTTVTSKNCAAM